MWKLYQESGQSPCTYSQYHRVFSNNFNLGFGSPKADICSFCVGKKQELANCSEEDGKKEKITELLVHRMRAKKFYTLMNEEAQTNTVTLCFDLMQNQVLPKTAIGEAYYSRQLYQYFFGVVHHKGGEQLQGKEEVKFYSWGENEAGRGANEIASCLYHYLSSYLPTGTKHVRLFSDACGGQNKNFTMLGMLSEFSEKHGITFSYYFPVRGHSYLPADRAFGRVEKELRRQDTILMPKEYFEFFRRVGDVVPFGMWSLHNWKERVKRKQSFKISDSKVLKVEGPRISKQDTYCGPSCLHTISRSAQKLCTPNVLPARNACKQPKRVDVMKLIRVLKLAEDSEAWQFYHSICSQEKVVGPEGSSDSDSDN